MVQQITFWTVLPEGADSNPSWERLQIDSKHLSICICTYFVFYALYYVI